MLLFGKQYTKNNKDKIGGVIKLFELFKEELSFNKIDYEVVDLNWRNYNNPLFAYIYIFYSAMFKTNKHTSISFHGTANEFIYLAPIVVCIGKLFQKKVSLRKFAGNFDEIYSNSGLLKKWAIEYSLRNSSNNFFETKYLVSYFSKFNTATYWFPNVRRKNNYSSNLVYNKRYIFVGHVTNEKGIRELVEAFSKLGSGFSLGIYGPLGDNFIEENFNIQNISYNGVLAPENVCKTMKEYDVLVLPSYREGYPGVIIEAFSVGIPVIASSLESISEMVTENVNGKLIRPRSADAIVASVLSLDVDTVSKLKKNATKSFALFDSKKITLDVITKINS